MDRYTLIVIRNNFDLGTTGKECKLGDSLMSYIGEFIVKEIDDKKKIYYVSEK